MKKSLISGILFLSALSFTITAQTTNDTLQKEKKGKKEKPPYLEPYHKNVIKFNPTPMVVMDVYNITFSYERMLKNNHSVALQAGYIFFPESCPGHPSRAFEFKDRSRSV